MTTVKGYKIGDAFINLKNHNRIVIKHIMIEVIDGVEVVRYYAENKTEKEDFFAGYTAEQLSKMHLIDERFTFDRNLLIASIEVIKKECASHEMCEQCPLSSNTGTCMIDTVDFNPEEWDAKEIVDKEIK